MTTPAASRCCRRPWIDPIQNEANLSETSGKLVYSTLGLFANHAFWCAVHFQGPNALAKQNTGSSKYTMLFQ